MSPNDSLINPESLELNEKVFIIHYHYYGWCCSAATYVGNNKNSQHNYLTFRTSIGDIHNYPDKFRVFKLNDLEGLYREIYYITNNNKLIKSGIFKPTKQFAILPVTYDYIVKYIKKNFPEDIM